MGVFNCSMFCCTLLYVHSRIAFILMGKRELVSMLNLSSWCLVMVYWLFLAVPWGCLRFVIVVFPDHTQLLFLVVHKTKGQTISGYSHIMSELISGIILFAILETIYFKNQTIYNLKPRLLTQLLQAYIWVHKTGHFVSLFIPEAGDALGQHQIRN